MADEQTINRRKKRLVSGGHLDVQSFQGAVRQLQPLMRGRFSIQNRQSLVVCSLSCYSSSVHQRFAILLILETLPGITVLNACAYANVSEEKFGNVQRA